MELPQDVYRFGDVELNISNLRLTVSGEVRPLEPKSFRLLQFLIENRHRVVPKDEILSVVWEGVAVSDNALTRAVAQIRKALDDDPKQPRYIETVPTVGYRFTGELRADAIPPVLAAAKKRTQFRPLVWVGVAAVLALAAVPVLRRAAPQVPTEPVPFTTYPGSERDPTFSPDGSQIAFSWTGEHDDNTDIYVKSVGSETPLRLTTDPAEDRNPKWSPDGRWIAFERPSAGGRIAIMLVPPLGGPERKLTEVFSHWDDFRALPDGIAWSPDGKWLAVSGDIGNRGNDRIFLVSVETGD
jgi:DNA-binding winged helix-turn-helix (wHTH) protein